MSWPPSAEDFKRYMAAQDARKPEQRVLDDIEELVNDELTHTPDDYTKNDERYDKCELCQQLWHGLPKASGCPGVYATPDQRKRWLERPAGTSKYIGYVTTEYEGIACAVHLYLDSRSGYVGLLMPVSGQDEHTSRVLDCDLYTFDEARATLTVHMFPDELELPVTYVPQLISPEAAHHILGLDTP